VNINTGARLTPAIRKRRWKKEVKRLKEEGVMLAYRVKRSTRKTFAESRKGKSNEPAIAKAEKYFALREEGVGKMEAVAVAGVSQAVEHTQAGQIVAANIDRQREVLQSRSGMMMADIAERLQKRAVNRKVKASDQNNADKLLIEMLDFLPAKKLDIKTTGMLIEFKDVSMAELLELRERALARQNG
jgi:hypothetical protein